MSDASEVLGGLSEGERIVLSDVINRVLDKGVVVGANISISIADVDLIQLDLRLLISSVTALSARGAAHGDGSVRADTGE